jgi:hypothetical protein
MKPAPKFGSGFWTPLSDFMKGPRRFWLCRCICGIEKTVAESDLKMGKSRSCGCRRQIRIKHGLTHTRTHRIWRAMRTRCTNANAPQYRRYGGRGITICERWDVFANFYADMGPAQDGMSIDRINPNGNYEPGNCRWATNKQQSRNKRPENHRLLTFNGRTQCLTAWCDELQLSSSAVEQRIDKLGWTVNESLTTPVQVQKR